MPTPRERLSSSVNHAGLWFIAALLAFSLVGTAWLPFHLARGGREPALLALPLEALVLFAVWRWGKRRSTHVWASPAGIELPGEERTIDWQQLDEIENLGMVGGVLMPLYRLRFKGGTRPLTFYARVDVPSTIAKFRR